MTINRGVRAIIAYETYIIEVVVALPCRCRLFNLVVGPVQNPEIKRPNRSPSAVEQMAAETQRGLEDKSSDVVVVAVIIDRIADEVTGSRHAIRQSIDVGQSDTLS